MHANVLNWSNIHQAQYRYEFYILSIYMKVKLQTSRVRATPGVDCEVNKLVRMYHTGTHGGLPGVLCRSLADGRAPAISLTTLRSALRRQRAAKKPGDGLLYALPSSEGSEVLATNSDGNVPAVDVQVRHIPAACNKWESYVAPWARAIP